MSADRTPNNPPLGLGNVEMATLISRRRHTLHNVLAAFDTVHPDAGERPVLTRIFWIQSAVAILLALTVRLGFLMLSRGMMDADEAVLGVQAERILQGARPIYFYGQAYMGSWDAYLLAPLVALFGPSAWAIHLVTLSESLLLIPLTGALALKLYGRRALLPALLLTALLPLFDTTVVLRMLGGYVETLVLGTALMLLVTLIVERWDQGRPTAVLWVVVGFLTGLALWIDLLIAYYVIACALWLAPFALARLLGNTRVASTAYHGAPQFLSVWPASPPPAWEQHLRSISPLPRTSPMSPNSWAREGKPCPMCCVQACSNTIS